MLVHSKFSEAAVILVEGALMSLPEAKWLVHQLLASCHPSNLEEFLAAASEETECVGILAASLDLEVDWDLASLTRVSI